MVVLVSALWWAAIVAGATALALGRPLTAVRLAGGLLTAVVVVWVPLCALGIAVQLQQGPGLHAVARATPFHAPHRFLNHAAVVLVAVAFCVAIPIAIERAVRGDGGRRLVLHLTLAITTEIFVLLSVFTGYLGRPPVTEGSYLRFRLLHTMTVPLIGTLSLLGWLVVVRRYRLAFTAERT